MTRGKDKRTLIQQMLDFLDLYLSIYGFYFILRIKWTFFSAILFPS